MEYTTSKSSNLDDPLARLISAKASSSLRDLCTRFGRRAGGGSERVGPRAVQPSTPGSYVAKGECAQGSEEPTPGATVISSVEKKVALKSRDLARAVNSAAPEWRHS